MKNITLNCLKKKLFSFLEIRLFIFSHFCLKIFLCFYVLLDQKNFRLKYQILYYFSLEKYLTLNTRKVHLTPPSPRPPLCFFTFKKRQLKGLKHFFGLVVFCFLFVSLDRWLIWLIWLVWFDLVCFV